MDEQIFDDGSVIYPEGAASESVFVIQRGEVKVLRTIGDAAVVLNVLGPGQIFGESGVLQNTPRSTTIQAKGEVTALRVTREEFLSAFGGKNPFALPLLRMLCERLSDANRKILETSETGRDIAKADEVSGITLLPASSDVGFQIGTEGIDVSDLPFVVGGRVSMEGGPKIGSWGLCLRAGDGLQISESHFAITKKDDQICIEDLGSTHGTIVNDRPLSRSDGVLHGPLWIGQNSVIAGGAESVFRFGVVVSRRSAAKDAA